MAFLSPTIRHGTRVKSPLSHRCGRVTLAAAFLAAASALLHQASSLFTLPFGRSTQQGCAGRFGLTGVRPQLRSRIALSARGGEATDSIAVGETVNAKSSEDENWYLGTVESANDDGTFTIKWADPDGGPESESVEAASIKLIYKGYKVGEAVEAAFPDDGNMYPGTVTKQNDDGTFEVKWEDADGGPETSPIKPEDMKYPPIPLDQLEIGGKYKGTVKTILDFGAFVDIGAEAEGLVHVSRISPERVSDIRDYLTEGQEVDCWVTEVRDDGKFGLSMVEGKVGGRPPPADVSKFADISSEDWLDGVVRRVVPFGAFVEVTNADGDKAQGLVHVSQIRDGFVDNIEEELSEGQEVKVRVQSVDEEMNRISLSMKEAFTVREAIDISAFESVSPDTWLTGTVASIKSFGAFVRVSPPDGGQAAEGLVHITQIKDGFVESVEDELQLDQEVKVRVTSVDNDGGKLGLSMIPETAEGGDGDY